MRSDEPRTIRAALSRDEDGLGGPRLALPTRHTAPPAPQGGEGETPFPRAATRQSIGEAWPIGRAIIACLLVLLLLNTGSLVGVVERRPSGPVRAAMLLVARPLDRAAIRLGLDRPMAWLDYAQVDRGDIPQFAAPRVPAAATPAPPTTPTATASAESPPGAASAGTTAVAAPIPTATAITPAPTATPAPPSRRAVTAVDPLRVYVAGDSFVNSLAEVLAETGERNGLLTVVSDGRPLSGLSTPDFLDWPARLARALVARSAPEVVVFMAGANDGIALRTPTGTLEYGTAAWNAEYGRRAGALMDVVGQGGGRLIYVGQPVMRETKQARIANDINVAVAEAATTRPWVSYVDSWSLLVDKGGAYSTFLIDERGETVRARTDDGIHLTSIATVWVANATYAAIRKDWPLP